MGLKLTQLAAKPQLVKITIDDEQTKERYGDELEFWILDRQPIEKFIKIASTISTDYSQAVALLADLVLDENGEKVMVDGKTLPNDLLNTVLNKIIDYLGK
jgi:hypothetical protein